MISLDTRFKRACEPYSAFMIIIIMHMISLLSDFGVGRHQQSSASGHDIPTFRSHFCPRVLAWQPIIVVAESHGFVFAHMLRCQFIGHCIFWVIIIDLVAICVRVAYLCMLASALCCYVAVFQD